MELEQSLNEAKEAENLLTVKAEYAREGILHRVKNRIKAFLAVFLYPYLSKQTHFNHSVTKSIVQLSEEHTSFTHQISRDTQRLDETRVRLQRELTGIKQRMSELAGIEQRMSELACIEQRMSELAGIEQQMTEVCESITAVKEVLSDHAYQLSDHAYQLSDLMQKHLGYGNFSSSQSGEDMIVLYIAKMLGISLSDISYLDLGANHAKYLSNTYYLYTRGARGVLVEANPYLIPELQDNRKGDVVLNRCITSASGETIDFYVLNNDGLSTFDKDSIVDMQRENPSIKIERTIPIRTITISEIVKQYFSTPPVLLNIDIEGSEMEILQSMDLTACRPRIIIIETIPYHTYLTVAEKRDDIVQFLTENNYKEYAFTGINSIFIDALVSHADKGDTKN